MSEKRVIQMLPLGDTDPQPCFWCPGCGCMHQVHVTKPNRSGAKWTWNQNLDKPTFKPSINAGPGYCHSYVTDGKIQFLSDCKHKLARQTVPLEPWSLGD